MGRSEVKPEKIADQHKVQWDDLTVNKRDVSLSTGLRFKIEELGPKLCKEYKLKADSLGKYRLTDRRRPRKIIDPFKKLACAKAEAEAIINKEAQIGARILLRGKTDRHQQPGRKGTKEHLHKGSRRRHEARD